jgi:hypothetical protein
MTSDADDPARRQHIARFTAAANTMLREAARAEEAPVRAMLAEHDRFAPLFIRHLGE